MSRYGMNKVFYEIVQSEDARERFLQAPEAFLIAYDLSQEERQAILELDFVSLYRMGSHPFLLQTWLSRVSPRGRALAFTEEYTRAIEPYGRPDFAT
ncbi:MAG TPA: hypothetical protein VNL15_00320 [Dehalococcoidia bacterium]|nr:hypothetical protein [Dehalococcoidia bacterium]